MAITTLKSFLIKILFLIFYDSSHYSQSLKATWLLQSIFSQKILRINHSAKFPISSSSLRVLNPCYICFHPSDISNFQTIGSYFQAISPIYIGKGTRISHNVGIITANHSKTDLSSYSSPQPVHIGNNCWIGMNSVILPGVTLGDNVIVGAGSVVTHSFPQGHITIAGNPAIPLY